LALAACGEQTLTRTEYAAKLDAMCRDFAARESRFGEPKTLPDLVAHGDDVAAAYDAAFGGVDELRAPDDVAAAARRIGRITEEQGPVLHRLAAAARRYDITAVTALAQRNDALNAEADKLSKQVGATYCAGER
jgi:hypothetical protein